MKTTLFKKAAILLVVAVFFFTIRLTSVKAATTSTCDGATTFSSSDISSTIPTDICPNGADAGTASQRQAAVFAWKEFIALNWPADSTHRGQPDTTAKFGDGDGPVVWETYQNKVETYPYASTATYPNPEPGFNQPPSYSYEEGQVTGSCTAQSSSSSTPYVNLDEADEIGLDNMFAGVAPTTPFPGQQFLYLAKANQTEYDYVSQNTYSSSNTQYYLNQTDPKIPKRKELPLLTDTANYLTTNKKYPKPGTDSTNSDGTAKYVSFPYGTIEIKTGWRQLNQSEVSEFHTAPVRYYKPAGSNQSCYQDAPSGDWGMGALHIIHKTPTAPYFIFATFDQINNLVDAGGTAIEKPDGTYKGVTPEPQPFLPGIVNSSQSSSIPKNEYLYVENPSTGPGVSQSFVTEGTQSSSFEGQYLYYENIDNPKIPANDNLPQPGQPIATPRRGVPIPATITTVNSQVQQVLQEYSPNAPWKNYRLVNVQWVPLTKTTFGQPYDGPYPGSYYLSNDVVETDYNLQFFSGQFYPKGNLISDFNDNGKFYNAYYNGQPMNMGGCLGCHGNAAVLKGSDSSFIFAGGPVSKPQHADDTETGLKKFFQLFGKP